MTCPNCGAALEGLTEYGDHACAACGLAGPLDVLEALAARLAPAGVLAEAERLLRGARVSEVQFYGRQVIVIAPWSDHGHADTLAEAYEKVRGGQ